MQSGYLSIESSRSHPGLIRLVAVYVDKPPRISSKSGPSADPAIRYVASFRDLDAARMHAHAGLRRHLVDLDAALYRVNIIEAIAAVEAIELRHRRVYLDPDLAGAEGTELERRINGKRARKERLDRIWSGVGLAAVIWLLLWALSPLL